LVAPLSVLLLSLAASPSAAPDINALSCLNGTRPIDEEGEPSSTAMGLIDEDAASPWEEPRADVETPTITLELAESFDLTALEAVNASAEAEWPGLSVKKLRVEVAASRTGPWKTLAETTLKKGTQPQRTKVSSSKVRYVRVTLLENHGSEDWTALGELRAFGTRSAPRKVEFTGAWDTNFGQMKLEQKGERIVGCYGSDESKTGDNTLEGTLEGSIFSGTWREKGEEGVRKGMLALALTTEGGLSGVWGNAADGKDRSARLDGKRRKKATISCDEPEKTLASELAATGRVVLRGILFDTGKDTLRSESIPVLEALAAAMKGNPKSRYLVEGHTDDRGGKDYNQKLSEQRAESVKAWLVKAGIEAARLRTAGFGLSKPAMSNDSEAGRAQNRRVEVAVEK